MIKKKCFAAYSIPPNASYKLSKSKSLYIFSVFAPSEEEVAKSRHAKQSATPSLRAVLKDPECYQGVKISKMFQQYLPENTLKISFSEI